MAIFTETEDNPGQEPTRSREELQDELYMLRNNHNKLYREYQILQTRLDLSESKRRNQRKQLRSYQKLWSIYIKGVHNGAFDPEPDPTT